MPAAGWRAGAVAPVTEAGVRGLSAWGTGFTSLGRSGGEKLGAMGAPDGGDHRSGLASVQVGDLCSGTVAAITRSGELEVALDGFPGPLSGWLGHWTGAGHGWPGQR